MYIGCWHYGGTQIGGRRSGWSAAAEGGSEPQEAFEGASESKRAVTNKLEERSAGAEAAEVRVAVVEKRLTGAARGGAGGGVGAENPGRGLSKSIVAIIKL